MIKQKAILLMSVIVFSFCASPSVFAQNNEESQTGQSLAEISLGTFEAAGEKAVLALFASLKNKLPTNPLEYVTDRMYHNFLPTLDISQTEDSQFENIYVGLEGFSLFGEEAIIPYAIGIEASRNFDSYAGLIEIGYAPGLQPKDKLLGILQRTFFADSPPTTLQAGYKFQTTVTDEEAPDLQTDKSGEDENEAVVRLRLTAALNTDNLSWLDNTWAKNFLGSNTDGDYIHLGIKGEATFWYSAIADEVHDMESICLEVYSPTLEKQFGWLKNKRINLSYQWGAGAPDFNKGEFFASVIKMKL